MGRSGSPDRGEWDRWLAEHSDRDPTSRRIHAVRSLESLGAEVIVSGADVANIEQMESVLGEARSRFGTIHGVFHAAAVIDDGVIQAKTGEDVERSFTPKVHGTLLLADLLGGDPLDFFLLFSSTSSILGPAGQVDYAASNSFLDSFAESSAGRRLNALVIDWGVWKDTGMAAGIARRMKGDEAGSGRVHRRTSHPLLDECIAGESGEREFATTFSTEAHWILDEHRTRGGLAIVPGTAYLELSCGVLVELCGAESYEIRDLSLLQPFVVTDGESREMRLLTSPSDGGSQLQVRSRVQGDWVLHASGTLVRRTMRHRCVSIYGKCWPAVHMKPHSTTGV